MFNSTSKKDINTLAENIRNIPEKTFVKIIPAILVADLMRLNLFFRIMSVLYSIRFRCSRIEAWKRIVSVVPDFFNNFKYSFADHIQYGHDNYDRKSVGGLCQAEIETLIEILQAYGVNIDEENI